MVAAFEQSLSSMTSRLQQLSSSSEVKDCELDRLRKTIEVLKQQGGSLVSGVKGGARVQLYRKGSTSDYTDGECGPASSTSNTLPKQPSHYKSHRYHKQSSGRAGSCSSTTTSSNATNSLLIRRHTFNNALLRDSNSKHYSSTDLSYGIYPI